MTPGGRHSCIRRRRNEEPNIALRLLHVRYPAADDTWIYARRWLKAINPVEQGRWVRGTATADPRRTAPPPLVPMIHQPPDGPTSNDDQRVDQMRSECIQGWRWPAAGRPTTQAAIYLTCGTNNKTVDVHTYTYMCHSRPTQPNPASLNVWQGLRAVLCCAVPPRTWASDLRPERQPEAT